MCFYHIKFNVVTALLTKLHLLLFIYNNRFQIGFLTHYFYALITIAVFSKCRISIEYFPLFTLFVLFFLYIFFNKRMKIHLPHVILSQANTNRGYGTSHSSRNNNARNGRDSRSEHYLKWNSPTSWGVDKSHLQPRIPNGGHHV